MMGLYLRRDVTWAARRWRLTDQGRTRAGQLVRSHRLWESYVAKHFDLPEDHLHAVAERAEHFIDPAMREELAAELQAPGEDPHGRTIPDEEEPRQP
jgi:manganese/zinc/iron transport system permease protein